MTHLLRAYLGLLLIPSLVLAGAPLPLVAVVFGADAACACSEGGAACSAARSCCDAAAPSCCAPESPARFTPASCCSPRSKGHDEREVVARPACGCSTPTPSGWWVPELPPRLAPAFEELELIEPDRDPDPPVRIHPPRSRVAAPEAPPPRRRR